MLNKIDLKKALENQGRKYTKELKDVIDTAVVQIVKAVSKTLEDYPTKVEIKVQFDGVNKCLDKVENRLDKVENRLEKVEFAVKDVKRDLNDLKADTPTMQDVQNHEKRILKIEQVVLSSP